MPGKMSLVLRQIFCFLISKLITVGTLEIDCNLHEKTLFQDIITLTVEYDIAILLEFKGEVCTLISLINVEPTLTDFKKFHPLQNKNPPSSFIGFLDFSTLHSSFIRVMY